MLPGFFDAMSTGGLNKKSPKNSSNRLASMLEFEKAVCYTDGNPIAAKEADRMLIERHMRAGALVSRGALLACLFIGAVCNPSARRMGAQQ